MLDSWSVHLTLYRMTPCWIRDLCIWHCTEWRHVRLVICASDIIQNDGMLDSWSVYLTLYWMTPRGLVICVSAIIQNDNMRSRVQRGVIQYNVRYTDHESNMLSFCIMADTQITSPSSFCIMSDTQITSPTCVILYYVRYTWTRDLCIWHYTGWRNVGLVICVSDIIQDDATLDSWSVYLTFTEWCHVGLMICVSDIIQNDAMLD